MSVTSLEPFDLLRYAGITRRARLLVADVQSAYNAGDWNGMADVARRAYEMWIDKGDWLGYAIVLMRVGDTSLKTGKLPLAKACFREAREALHYRVDPKQRQNEAAAAYGLGLVNRLLGFDEEAVDWFEEALRLLAEARGHWAVIADDAAVVRCDRATARVKRLADHIVAQHHAKQCGGPGSSVTGWSVSGKAEEWARSAIEISCENERALGLVPSANGERQMCQSGRSTSHTAVMHSDRDGSGAIKAGQPPASLASGGREDDSGCKDKRFFWFRRGSGSVEVVLSRPALMMIGRGSSKYLREE